METALLSNYDEIVTEIRDSLKQLKIESTIQMHASKKEFKEILSKGSESNRKNQTIFCVIKMRRKPGFDERSGQSSPYIMFHSIKLFKVLFTENAINILPFLLKKSELTNGAFPDLAENRHLSKTIVSVTDSVRDHYVKQSGKFSQHRAVLTDL